MTDGFELGPNDLSVLVGQVLVDDVHRLSVGDIVDKRLVEPVLLRLEQCLVTRWWRVAWVDQLGHSSRLALKAIFIDSLNRNQ